MLGLHRPATDTTPDRLCAELTRVLGDFDACRYGSLAERLPRLIVGAHALGPGDGDEARRHTLLARVYLLTTRVLVKLDDDQLGWMAADRARRTAQAGGDTLTTAEAARNLAMLARRAGWHDQAMSIALTAADHPDLRAGGTRAAAERGLLLQSAAYTAAKNGDRDGMRELTDEAAAIATRLGGILLRDHGGGFDITTVGLHRISAESSTGDPSAAISAAHTIAPHKLPTVERRARYFTDVAAAYGQWGRRDDCLQALLAAERQAPEETHTRPAVRNLVTALLVSGRITPQLRGLAARCGVN